ncbi:hypothetical protein [Salinibacterium sp. M195]|uniref:hypothetical protein n=1 Tax=Salinibacterium sp. M195 TaxID=2583374 RepID=UPI001C63A398|nr:hypothetical protein [Salinibacterium sp. M195]QYH36252.1 hypothetical protein FFT87_09960 [Salinibacterium sp. M195]
MTTLIDLKALLTVVEKSKRHDGTIDENSVLKLTLVWELDIDHVAARNDPDSLDEHSQATATPARNSQQSAGKSDDWRTTVAQFPEE